MKVLFRSIAALLIAFAALLVYAVIHALASDGGARAGVAVAYIVGAIILAFAAVKLWGAADRRGSSAVQA